MDSVSAVLAARYALGDATPIKADCGMLCGSVCCENGGEKNGMLLLPGEASLLAGSRFARLSYVKYEEFSRPVFFMECAGRCPRDARPIACRLFPLIPYVKKEDRGNAREYVITGDPRGARLCPLLWDGPIWEAKHVDPGFRAAVERAVSVLWKSAAVRRFFSSLSAQMDDYIKFFPSPL